MIGGRLLSAAGALVAMVAAGCGTPVVETQRFRFAPPEGQELELKVKGWRSMGILGVATVNLTLEGSSHVRVKRLSAWNLEWLETLDGLRVDLDGRDLLPGLSRRVAGTQLRYKVMDDGDLMSVEGFDRFEWLLREAAAERGRTRELEAVSPWEVREREREDWNERIHALVGRPVVLGEVVETSSRIDLGQGVKLAHMVRLTPVEWRPCGDGRCVAVRVEYLADPEATARFIGQSASSLVPRSEEIDPTVTIRAIEVAGGGERLIDPATMLVFAENVERKLHLTLASDDGQSLTVSAIDGQQVSLRIAEGGSSGS